MTVLSAHAQGTPPAPAPTAAASADTGPPIDVLEFAVEGNSVLSARAIEEAVLPFLGPGRRMGEIEQARASLERAYHARGYLTVYVDLPEQRVDDGVVRLSVVEGRIARTSVTGSRYHDQGWIRERLPAFAEQSVPDFNAAQQQLAVVNRSEDRRVQPVLRPGLEPGSVEIELKVEDRLPLSGSVELHNRHAADTSPWRLQTSWRYDNLWQRDHAIAFTASVAPADLGEARALILNYTVPFDNGHSLVAYAVDSTTEVSTLGGTTVLGDGRTIGLRYAVPFFAAGGAHSVTLGVDYKDLDERIEFGGEAFRTPLRYLPLHLGWDASWAADGVQTQASVSLSAGTRSFLQRDVDCPGSTVPVDQFACKRYDADGSFAALKADVRHSRPVGAGSLAVRFGGQIASQPLASSEQYALGGADTVRGYLDGEAIGDHGVLGSIEWRSGNLASAVRGWLPALADAPFSELTLLAFVEGGRVQITKPLPEQQARFPLWSSGGGLRLSARGGWSLALDVARAHKTLVQTRSGDVRVHARVGWTY